MNDLEIKKIINDFLPNKMFDVHMHLYDKEYMLGKDKSVTLQNYYLDMQNSFSGRGIEVNILPYPSRKIALNNDFLKVCDDALYNELYKNPFNVGEILVMPYESEESVLSRIKSEQIVGFKCYHSLNKQKSTFNLNIEDYLPESAFCIADKYNKVITLHMVKDKALSDNDNLNYIIKMAKKYPNATLILAHCATSFASWTAVESVDKIKHLDNVWFDFSAICESPSIFQIIKKCGTSRVTWGTDYPISNLKGKPISIADKFCWVLEETCPNLQKEVPFLKIYEENILAIRQASIMLDLTFKDVEDIFYNNAKRLFSK